MPIHWPEISKFFGIFSLNVGVYVHTVSNLMYNGWLLYFLWSLFLKLTRVDFNFIYVENDEDSSEVADWKTVLHIVLLSVIITISVYKTVETLSLVVLLCGVWMKKPAIVKIYTYFGVVNWIITVVLSIIVSIFIEVPGRLILLSVVLIHAYMILNIRSLYLQMSGESRVVLTSLDTMNPSVLETNATQFSNNQEVQTTVSHCRTCTCNPSIATSTSNETFGYQILNSNTSTVENTPTMENRTIDSQIINRVISNNNRPTSLNLRMEPASHEQNELELHRRDSVQSLDLIQDVENSEGVIDGESNTDDKKRNAQEKEIMPVIYDENQLNVGTSPLFELNPIIETTDLRMRYINNTESSTN